MKIKAGRAGVRAVLCTLAMSQRATRYKIQPPTYKIHSLPKGRGEMNKQQLMSFRWGASSPSSQLQAPRVRRTSAAGHFNQFTRAHTHSHTHQPTLSMASSRRMGPYMNGVSFAPSKNVKQYFIYIEMFFICIKVLLFYSK